MVKTNIEIRGAAENNLKSVDVDLPRGRLVAITGVSGSGKSSLAFDTLYAEARRRFLLSMEGGRELALGLPAPSVETVEGLSPAAAVGQERARRDPRATVGSVCGAGDYLRLFFAKLGRARCLSCGAPVAAQRFEEVWERAAGLTEGTRLMVLAPRRPQEGEDGRAALAAIERGGYRRLRLKGEMFLLEEVTAARVEGEVLEVVIDRLVVKPGAERRLRGSLQAALEESAGQVVIAEAGGAWEERFSVQPSCSVCATPFPPLTPELFLANGARGACPRCRGGGVEGGLDGERLFAGGRETLESALGPLWSLFGHADLRRRLEAFCSRRKVNFEEPLAAWEGTAAQQVWEGEGRRGGYMGLRRVLEALRGKAAAEEQAFFDSITAEAPCPACGGARLRPEALAVEVGGESIAVWGGVPVVDLPDRLRTVGGDGREASVYKAIADPLLAGLHVLDRLGLGYLHLDRRADTLSGGEYQRVRLAAILGSQMTRMLYVLDEPSAGLHPSDAGRLAGVLADLRDTGNTVVMVEHDPELIGRADWVIEVGPEAGAAGGQIVSQGPPEVEGVAEQQVGRRRGREAGVGGWLRLEGAAGHNLREIDVDFPLGNLVCISGVSGSGKSSLVQGTLYPLLAAHVQRGEGAPLAYRACRGLDLVERVVAVDQRPIGRTPRSNAATYTGVLGGIRRLFAETAEARLRGYLPGHFSFNAAAGACESCGGSGVEDLGAGEELVGACPACGGRRYRPEILSVRYRGHSIADVLELNVENAAELFGAVPDIARRLGVLSSVGLGYLHLGQPATSLSGGEAQRVKLAAELGRPRQTHTLYLLDEPTTGLHRRDVAYLLELLQRLVDEGNTVVVVEHHTGLLAAADYIIDLGPDSGRDGGRVVACGTPQEIAAAPNSRTGGFLAPCLEATNGP